MFFRDADALMAQEHRDTIHGHASAEEFTGESVAEAVSMAFWNFCEFEESLETPLPLPYRTVKRRRS